MQESSQIFRVEVLKTLSFVSLLVSCYPPPPPPPGYFGRKILIFSDLQTICVGKIFITKELRLKYLFSTNWFPDGQLPCGACSFFLDSI